MWLPHLILIALNASPALDPAQLTQRIEQLSQRQRDENHLLNLQLPLPNAAWTGSTWRSLQVGDLPDKAVPIRIVHLWADWCPPCKAEFPRLKKVVQQLQISYGKDVRLILVSETTDDQPMMKYWQENASQMPLGMQFGDNQHELMWAILQALPQNVQAASLRLDREPGRELPLPITLVTDTNNVVRLAYIGSLDGRYGQFINGIEQLHRTLKSGNTNRLVAGRPIETQLK